MDGRNIRHKSCLKREQNRFILVDFAAPVRAGNPRIELYTDRGTLDKWLPSGERNAQKAACGWVVE
jgi:hypothetical protein